MKPLALLLTVTLTGAHAAALPPALHGAVILAADGTFLGTCDGPIGFTSIGNSVSPYGSSVGFTSMYNTVSLYGSSVGFHSPYNTVSLSAPYLLRLTPDLLPMITASRYNADSAAKAAVAASLRRLPMSTTRVSVNTTYLNTVHPDVLRQLCGGS